MTAPSSRCWKWTLLAVLLALGGLAPRDAAAAPPRKNDREMHAREAYAAGRYREALDIYVKLYAEQLHPNYLRNIGRCYQNLEEADSAISSFREYLRKAKNVTPAERTEIEGYIGEMQELKRKRAAAATPPPNPETRTTPPSDPGGPKPLTPPPPPPQVPIVHDQPPPPAEEAPVYKRWWFWTLVGGAVAAGTVGVILARGNGKTDLCAADRNCLP
jgi:tetratricopeptide (TPR) repeat protein